MAGSLKNIETRFRTFPIVRRSAKEHHLFLGFDSNLDAQNWVDWGIREGFLREALKAGEPGKPAKARPVVPD